MKKITLEDVNNAILGTNIKILSTINILDLNNFNIISENLFGVYVIYLKYKESYIGKSSSNKGIQGRLSRHVCETWHRNIIESIDIFITNDCHVSSLERILIKTFKPELNTTMYDNCSLNQFLYVQKELELNNDNCNLINDKINDINAKQRHVLNPITISLNENNVIYNNYEDDYKDIYNNNYENYDFLIWLKNQKRRNDPIGDISLDLRKNLKIRTIENRYPDILYEAYNEYLYIYSNYEYREQSENFGLILIDSLNPELNKQIYNDNTFEYNYNILCRKYDEIKAIYLKNCHNTWEERIYNTNGICSDKNTRSIWNTKLGDVKKNCYKLLLEINNEIKNLLIKYGKDKDCIKGSFYYSLINQDLEYFLKE